MEHSELVEEMSTIEQMSTQERLQLAKRRRRSQLKAWASREMDWLKRRPSGQRNNSLNRPGIRFSDNVILLEAASRNDILEVRKLLMRGVSPDSTNEDGLTALHQCCIDDNEEMMKLLLEFGANVNAEDSEKWTPLHAAATCGHLHLVKHLIANGANLLAVNGDGNMPYDICEDEASLEEIEGAMARRGVTQAVIDETRAAREMEMLHDLSVGDLDMEVPLDFQLATPLHIAAANGYLRVVEFLLDHHVSTDVKDIDGWQPVHAAACWGHIEAVELLVQNGADLNARTKHDETPADICEDPELRERIIELRSEQESKRLAERRRVRRSQSNNSRAHSVRRTSIRERGLTAKRDAAQEARFRLHVVSGSNQVSSGAPHILLPVGSKIVDGDLLRNNVSSAMNSVYHHVDVDEMASLGTPNNRREPDGRDCSATGSTSPQMLQQQDILKPMTPTTGIEVPTETSYSTESNGKINIHVSVTINAGTLAELKKQRAQNRTTSPDASSVLSAASLSDLGILPPVKRFSGDTSENVIGDSSKSTRCCVIMYINSDINYNNRCR
ncbi:myosin phosphatase targeting subunit 75D isoform X2 [Rhodnius prolixus]|uniref:myosin phosphatase targeting subunit 75D isoform X2 n=1 Tax=Rhodnius prolixus TaxID=13249 RepID=UPI003D18A0F9